MGPFRRRSYSSSYRESGWLPYPSHQAEDVEVLLHAIAVRALRDADHTALQQPAQHDLPRRLIVFMGDLQENRILEDIVVALGKRCPGFLLDIVLFHESCFIPFLVPDVRLDLVDSRLYLI